MYTIRLNSDTNKLHLFEQNLTSSQWHQPILTVYVFMPFHNLLQSYIVVSTKCASRENTRCADLSTFDQGAVRLKQFCTAARQLIGPCVRRIINSGYPSELSR